MLGALRNRFAKTRVAAVILLLASFHSWGNDAVADWRLDKDEGGIQVFSREIEGSPIRAVRAEVDIKASLSRTVALLLDAAMRPRWDEICAESSIYARVSEAEDLIYVHNALPWPVSDRDMVLRRRWTIAADGSKAVIRAAIEAGVLPEVAGRVRVERADGVWTVEPIDASNVRVSTEIHADPGGPIPGWLMNSLSIQGPHQALANIRQLLESGGYTPAVAAQTAVVLTQ